MPSGLFLFQGTKHTDNLYIFFVCHGYPDGDVQLL